MKKTVLEEKDFLNPEEAIVYFKLSRRKFHKLLTDGLLSLPKQMQEPESFQ